jgi:hypothetical protein
MQGAECLHRGINLGIAFAGVLLADETSIVH